MIPQSSTVLGGLPSFLMVLTMKTLVASRGVSSYLVWPFEIWLILGHLQDLMYWLSKHRANHLRSRRPRLPNKIPSWPTIIVSVQPKIPLVLWDNLSFSLPLLLVFLNPLVFVNTIHKPTHTPYRLLGCRHPISFLDYNTYILRTRPPNDELIKWHA